MANKHSKHGFVPRLCRLALGAGFVALSATAAQAEPTTYWEAQAKAEQYEKKAQQYRDLGGAGYKSGLVRQADTEAAKYTALADKLGAGPDEESNASGKEIDGQKVACQSSKPAATIACKEAHTKQYAALSGKETDAQKAACQSSKPVTTIACNEAYTK